MSALSSIKRLFFSECKAQIQHLCFRACEARVIISVLPTHELTIVIFFALIALMKGVNFLIQVLEGLHAVRSESDIFAYFQSMNTGI